MPTTNPMTVERHCAERDLAPLLLTDNDAFQLFRGRRVLFEFLPARADQERFAAELDWRLFTLRRLALIRRKWRPVRVIAFGRPVPRSSSCGSTRRSRRRRSRRGTASFGDSTVRRLAAALLGLPAPAITALTGSPTSHAQGSPSADDAAWNAASEVGTAEACEQYLEALPAGQHAEEAFRCLVEDSLEIAPDAGPIFDMY